MTPDPKTLSYCFDKMCRRYLKAHEVDVHKYDLRHDVQETPPEDLVEAEEEKKQ